MTEPKMTREDVLEAFKGMKCSLTFHRTGTEDWPEQAIKLVDIAEKLLTERLEPIRHWLLKDEDISGSVIAADGVGYDALYDVGSDGLRRSAIDAVGNALWCEWAVKTEIYGYFRSTCPEGEMVEPTKYSPRYRVVRLLTIDRENATVS